MSQACDTHKESTMLKQVIHLQPKETIHHEVAWGIVSFQLELSTCFCIIDCSYASLLLILAQHLQCLFIILKLCLKVATIFASVVSEMTYNVFIGTLKPTHSLIIALNCLSGFAITYSSRKQFCLFTFDGR